MNQEVSNFLDNLSLPRRDEINLLRKIVLESGELIEDIKWNGPNYSYKGEDRITMRVQPPLKLQLIFHCGAKTKAEPPLRLISDDKGLLEWKGNDRAVLTIMEKSQIRAIKNEITQFVKDWFEVTCMK